MAMTEKQQELAKDIKQLRKDMQRKVERIRDHSQRGLKQAAVEIMQDTEETPPLNPYDTGNLVRSMYIVGSDGSSPRGWGGQPTFVNAPGRNAGEMSARHAAVVRTAQAKAEVRSEAGKRPTVIMGYSAHYAPYVHEGVFGGKKKGKAANWTRPSSGPFFFESSYKRNALKAVQIVKAEAEIGARK